MNQAFYIFLAILVITALSVVGSRMVFKIVRNKFTKNNMFGRRNIKTRYSRIAYSELSAQMIIICGVVVLMSAIFSGWYFYNKGQAVDDVEVLSGRVISKTKQTVSCSHSYSCNCRPVTKGYGKDQYVVTECDTCYEHNHDYDWEVSTSVGDLNIDRIDRQGADMPPRWKQVVVGEPAAKMHTYVNWIKGAKMSVFNREAEKTAAYSIPAYPSVFDYYRIRRIVSDSPAVIGSTDNAETYLANELRTLGPDKQVAVSIFHSVNKPQDWARAIYNHYSGGKKNDAMIVISTDPVGQIQWVKVTSYSSKDIFNVALRDDILNVGNIKQIDVISQKIVYNVINNFTRTRMRTFQYLENEIDYFSIYELSVLLLLTMIVSIVATVVTFYDE